MAPKGRRKAVASQRKNGGEVPDVYQEMLAEAVSSPVRGSSGDRPVKKRRIAGSIVHKAEPALFSNAEDSDKDDHRFDELFEEAAQYAQQHMLKSESEDSADSDVDWENVDLQDEQKDTKNPPSDDDSRPLNITLDRRNAQSTSRPRRKAAATAIEKKLRLEIHKMNICCLLAHVHIRNHWCSDREVHSILRKRLNDRAISYVHPRESFSQFQRSRSFMDGLEQVYELFRVSFRTKSKGMVKPQWREQDVLADILAPAGAELPVEKEDFLEAARSMEGSRDTGAQLFCSMLRAAGVATRLICSLQPLQFRAVEKVDTPQRQYTMMVPDTNSRQATPESTHEESSADSPIATKARKKHSRPGENGAQLPTRAKAPLKSSPQSKYPIFWVEAFNAAVQGWIPLDPLATKTINKRSKFEPPLGDPSNTLSYVLAFESDGSAVDVTRRYAKAYNAKTRRERIESTQGGARWWRRVMKQFRRQGYQDRDEIEAAELNKHEAQEPMPRNVTDFKDHPYYALERHLRRHEVIHPRREVGKVGASGRGHDSKTLEPIFRRSDVQNVLSADKWFRKGREVKGGEQALKFVVPMRRREKSNELDDDVDEGDRAGTPLYAIHQTERYRARPVQDGTVPRNKYGNLDIYVPSMIPSGGAHVKHPLASRAARICSVDFADAVTGFKFSGRHGSAVTNGVVVPSNCVEGICEVIRGLEHERVGQAMQKRADAALKMWRKFMVGLRIRERIESYDVEGEDVTAEQPMQDKMDEDEGYEYDAGGGFLPDAKTAAVAQPNIPTAPNRRDEPDATSALDNAFGADPTEAFDIDTHIPITYGPPLPTNPTTDAAASKKTKSLFSPSPSPAPEDNAGGFITADNDTHPTRTTVFNIDDGNIDEDNDTQTAIALSLASSTAAAAIGVSSTDQPPLISRRDSGLVNHQPQDMDMGMQTAGVVDVLHGAEEQGTEDEDEDSDDEVGSLLSHDPDDEEVEEEWPEDGEEDF